MAWDRRGYYYRSQKSGGRVLREYYGAGEDAALIAQLDELGREEREARRAALRAEQAELDALDAKVKALVDLTDLAARAALAAAGYHRHKRGEWRRKRRGKNEPAPGPLGDPAG